MVQAVLLILVLASLSSWFLIVQRVMLMRRADDELLVFEEQFWSGIDLAQLYREGNQAVADGQLPTGVEGLFRAGFKEFSRLSQQSDMDADAILEGSREHARGTDARDRPNRAAPSFSGVGRLHQPLHRIAGNSVGHHAFLQGAGQRDASHLGDRRAGHLGGVDRHGNGALCRYSCRIGL